MKQAPYFPIIWDSTIAVQLQGNDLLVTGKLPLLDSDIEHSRDPYLQYVRSVKSKYAQKQTGRNSPHIRFANALDDVRLTAFVREFGPVVPSEVSIHEPPDLDQMSWDEPGRAERRSTISAVQTLPTLRREQRTYAAALRLMVELRRGEDKSDGNAILQHVSEIAEGVWYWPGQYEAERVWRKARPFRPPIWHFDSEDRSLFSMCKHHVERRLQYEKTPPPDKDAYSDFDAYLTAFGKHAMMAAMIQKTDN